MKDSNLREEDGVLQKQCSKCHEWRRIPEAFPLDLQNADGFGSWCHRCHKSYDAQRRARATKDKNAPAASKKPISFWPRFKGY